MILFLALIESAITRALLEWSLELFKEENNPKRAIEYTHHVLFPVVSSLIIDFIKYDNTTKFANLLF